MTDARGDAALRELEHALSESPHDGGLRLRLARELARLERRGDALHALDLATFPDASFVDARALADELWSRELAGLTRAKELAVDGRVTSAAIDPTGRWVASVVEPRRVVVDDLKTRERLDVEGAPGALPFDNAFVARDAAYVHPGGATLFRIPLRAPLEAERVTFEGLLLDVAPEGGRVYLAGVARWGIYSWPDLTPVFERARTRSLLHRETGEGASVLWSEQRILVHVGDRSEVIAFAGNVVTTIERPKPASVWLLGRDARQRGILALLGEGLDLLEIESGARLPVLTKTHGLQRPLALARDGRSLHLLVDGHPRRVVLDLARGTMTPDATERDSWSATPAIADSSSNSVHGHWHPFAGAIALWISGDLEVRGLTGTLLKIPGARPRGWSQDGHSLLVDRWSETGSRLEVWRTPATRPAGRATPWPSSPETSPTRYT